MTISRLDHVNLRTNRLQEMIDWYADVLDLHQGERPDFPFPGAWLYAGKHAVIHLVGVDGDPGAGSEQKLKLEHFALSASDRLAFEAKLEDRGIAFRRSEKPVFDLIQVNIWDPDGNHIHIDFPFNE